MCLNSLLSLFAVQVRKLWLLYSDTASDAAAGASTARVQVIRQMGQQD